MAMGRWLRHSGAWAGWMIVLASAVNADAARQWVFTDGRWFDGDGFVETTVCVEGDRFVACSPTPKGERVSLSGGYVVPPFGDAHTHNFSDASEEIVDLYLAHGVFYVQVLNNPVKERPAVEALVNRPDSVDVVWANGGLTSTLSHPAILYEALALGAFTPADRERLQEQIRTNKKRDRDAYWRLDTPADLDRDWDAVLDGSPDLLKVFLLDAHRDPERSREGTGLDPALLPEIVDRSRRIGLPVYAHVETPGDFRLALRAGVDGFAHLPGYADVTPAGPPPLAPADIRLAGRRGVVVVPTIYIGLENAYSGDELPNAEVRKTYYRRTLRALHAAGARIAIGTDVWRRTSRDEAMKLQEVGIFDNRTLLALSSVTTPQVIFPDRQIGVLAPGYEASFLVLAGDPIADFTSVERIERRFKQGRPLE